MHQSLPTDLGNPQAIEQLVSRVHAKLGPLNVLHWNAYAFGAGDTRASARRKPAVAGVSEHACPDLEGKMRNVRVGIVQLQCHPAIYASHIAYIEEPFPPGSEGSLSVLGAKQLEVSPLQA